MCQEGYVIKNGGRSCWCAPGYYRDDDTGLCFACGSGYYCPGARATAASGSVRLQCGENKMTTTTYAKSYRECVVKPGYGWTPGDMPAALCPVGFYSPGLNNRRCTRCPGGLTTVAPGSTAVQDCGAPAGSFYLSGKAMPCAKGSFKAEIGNTDCQICPDGFTTAPGTVAATDAADCKYVVPGYEVAPGTAAPAANATRCPMHTYRSEETELDTAAGVPCKPCPANMQTQDEGATSVDACLAPPGYGLPPRAAGAAALANSSAAAPPAGAILCPLGSYNPGWNKEPCTLCGGEGLTTDALGSQGADDCKIPRGYGTSRDMDAFGNEVLSAAPCPADSFGRSADTYGLVDVECSKCPDLTFTKGPGSDSPTDCLTHPGYGWYAGGVTLCDYGTYSVGGSQLPCASCNDGRNTSTLNGTTLEPTDGATSQEQCVTAAGWTPVAGGVKPCPQGYYKPVLGDSACTKCPDGTWTSTDSGAVALSDCDVCRPGFGADDGAISTSGPSCQICPSGTFSPGKVRGGAPCQACPNPSGFLGRMVSRQGLDNPDGCQPEFSSDGFENFEVYDIITMSDSALTVVSAATTVEACQAACSASADCQYFAFLEFDGVGPRCSLRDKVAYTGEVNTDDFKKSYAVFKVDVQTYVAYEAHPSDTDSLGQILGTFNSRSEAQDACDLSESCAGLKSEIGSRSWRTFKGTLWEGAAGKVRVTGANINPWVAQPSAN